MQTEQVRLPTNVDAERTILGGIMLDDTHLKILRGVLSMEDFALEKHRRIFQRMMEMADRGDHIDRITLANELMKFNELEACDGFGYLMSLDDQTPQMPSLDSYARIVLDKSALRRLVFAGQSLINRCAMEEDSPSEIITALRESLLSIEEGSHVTQGAETIFEIIDSLGGVSELFKPRIGIQTPWREINEATGGWNAGDLSIVAARPSMGKTSFALNAAYYSAKCGVPTAFYSCEMTQESLIKRMLSMLTGISFMDIQQARLNTSERRACADALASIGELPLRIMAAGGKTATAICSHIERLSRKGLCKFAAVDYIGLVRGTSSMQNRTHELGDIAKRFKLLCLELKIAMLVLSQLSRGIESRTDKRPTMSDIRDSGEIEEHADVIGMLYRPEYYNRDEPGLRGQAEYIIQKQRNGPTPVVQLTFDHHRGLFQDPQEQI